MAFRFNPPPNWPTFPEDFIPDENWQPDPEWGPAPESWNFWVDDAQPAASPATDSAASTYQPQRNKLRLGYVALALTILAVFVPVISLILRAVSQTKETASDSSDIASTPQPTADSSEFQSARDTASEIPHEEFPASTYKEISSDSLKDAKTDDTKVTVPVEYYSGFFWLEFIYTPSEAGDGSVCTADSTEQDFTCEGTRYAYTSNELRWDDSGQEHRILVWINIPVTKGNTDHESTTKISAQVDLPEGSAWKLRIHPAIHAPVVSSTFKANESQAFYYDATNNQYMKIMGQAVNDADHFSLVDYGFVTQPVAVSSGSNSTIPAIS